MILCDDAQLCRENKIGVSIIYAYEDSDVFYPAKLLKHGKNCLCFASKEPIVRGEKIYIFTQDFPIKGENHKIYEGIFAQVEECKKTDNFKNNPSYLIRGKSEEAVHTIAKGLKSNDTPLPIFRSSCLL